MTTTQTFATDLTKMNARLDAMGALVTLDDGSVMIDPTGAPAALVQSYGRLVQFGYANGLI